jgi:hypothetical protein
VDGAAAEAVGLGTGDLQARVDYESRRLAAAAWLYHLGLVLFSGYEHGRHSKSVARLLGAAAGRDLVLAILSYQRWRVPCRAEFVLGVVTDVPLMRSLARHLDPVSAFEDRSLSQFGLAAGLGALLDPWPGSSAAAWAAPAVLQAHTARALGLRGRTAAAYVAREFAWSAAALSISARLRRLITAAIEQRVLDELQSAENARRAAAHAVYAAKFNPLFHEVRIQSVIAIDKWTREISSCDSDVADLRVLCKADIDRLRRFHTKEATVSELTERLAVHRRLRGLETTIAVADGLAGRVVSNDVARIVDHVTDTDLVGAKGLLTVTVSGKVAPFGGDAEEAVLVAEADGLRREFVL